MEFKNNFNRDLRVFIDKSGITVEVGINIPSSLVNEVKSGNYGRVARGKKFWVLFMSKKITSGYDIDSAYLSLKRKMMIIIRKLKVKHMQEEIDRLGFLTEFEDEKQMKINFIN